MVHHHPMHFSQPDFQFPQKNMASFANFLPPPPPSPPFSMLMTSSLSSNSRSFACAFNNTNPNPNPNPKPFFFPAAAAAAAAIRRRRRAHLHSSKIFLCRSTDDSKSNPAPAPGRGLDRRDMLIGLGGLYGAAAATDLGREGPALANPVQVPDFSKCKSVQPRKVPAPVDCCPPFTDKIIDFKRPSSREPMRVRPAAHLADPEYVAKYEMAIDLMRKLDKDDPRSFIQQAKVHCAYCEGGYEQIGFPDLELQIHNSWLFFPFHRLYLYFNERILGKLIGDDTFALPFWNWDSPGGMSMPLIFADESSPLYNKKRNPLHQPPFLLDLNYSSKNTTVVPPQEIIDNNLKTMYRQVISGGKKPEVFMGAKYRAGDAPNPGPGSIETVPHTPLHIWCGDPSQPANEDMGSFYSAGRDPLFYSHHANVDRMWYLWKNIVNRKRKDFDDPDWLNTSFLFYDENADLVRVSVKDCLETHSLRYTYQDVDIPWLKSRPSRIKLKKGQKKRVMKSIDQSELPVTLEKAVSVTVKRPQLKRSTEEKENAEEVLVVGPIEYDRDYYIKFDVYVNGSEEDGVGAGSSEFAGSFVSIPHKHDHSQMEKKLNTTLRLALTDLLEDIDAEKDETLQVRFVLREGKGKVTIDGVGIEFI